MATIIVGHQSPDTDCLVSIVALESVIRQRFGFAGRIDFVFIPQGETYRGVAVNPANAFEISGQDRVYHVDCGLGLFDQHRLGCTEPSSLSIINKQYQLGPQWKRILEWVELEDQGKLNGGLNLPQIIRGLNRQGDRPHEVFQFVKTAIYALLTNEELLVSFGKHEVQNGVDLGNFVDNGEPYYFATMKNNGRKIGIGIVPNDDHLGNASVKLQHCTVWVLYSRESGIIKIHTQSENNPNARDIIDLNQIGIVRAIRAVEASRREMSLSEQELRQEGNISGMAWFAFKANDRIISLLHGSTKTVIAKDQMTRLNLREILNIVIAQVVSK